MSCVQPLTAWYGAEVNPDTGKRPLVFRESLAMPHASELLIPCGKCPPCRAAKVKDLSTLCSLEIIYNGHSYNDSVLLTLTFDDDHLDIPNAALAPTGTVRKEHMKHFHKHLRMTIKRYYDANPHLFPDGNYPKYKYLQCGEYGGEGEKTDLKGRPHYHLLIMGFGFPDRVQAANRGKTVLFHSDLLSQCWPHGFYDLQTADAGAAAYITKYAAKSKLSGQVDNESIETTGREAQFVSRSRGIGKAYCLKFANEILRKGEVVPRGCKRPVAAPKWTLKTLEPDYPDKVSALLESRKEYAMSETPRLPRHNSMTEGYVDMAAVIERNARKAVIKEQGKSGSKTPITQALSDIHSKALEGSYSREQEIKERRGSVDVARSNAATARLKRMLVEADLATSYADK